MKNIIKNLVTIVTIVAGIVAILSFVYQIKSNNPKLEVLEISNDNLTNLPKVKNLKSNFYYKDSLITNLWKLNASIKNISSKTIIGKGTNKNIIDKNLVFKLNNGFKLIDFNINETDFPNGVSIQDNEIEFNFTQWRKDEKIEVTIYAEQISGENNELELLINEREIVDGIVEHRKINQPEEKDSRIIDLFPTPLASVLFWIGIIFYGFFLLILPIGLVIEINKYVNYQKWKRNWLNSFNEKISTLHTDGEILITYKPENTPVRIWEKLDIPKPDVPTNTLPSMIIGVVLAFCLVIIPILWMIKI
ncbi:hypothetical protein [Lacinutrix undariae]